MKYSAKSNNYKHGDNAKYILHRESIFTVPLHKHNNDDNSNNNDSNNNRYIGLEIYACCMYVGEEGILVGKPREKGPLGRP
jgi:hypothetical protein